MKNRGLLIVSLIMILCGVVLLWVLIRKGIIKNPFKKSSTTATAGDAPGRQPLVGPLTQTEINNYLSYYTIYQIAMLNAGVSQLNSRIEKLESAEWI